MELHAIFNQISSLVTNDELKYLHKQYKNKSHLYNTLQELCDSDDSLHNIIEKAGVSTKLTITSHLASGDALQPGMLTECIFLTTIAKKLSLNLCQSADNINVGKLMNPTLLNKARFIYYNTYSDNYIVQYGDPTSIDAVIVYDNKQFRLEIKENKAKAEEVDITGCYNELGKLTPNQKFKAQRFLYMPLVDAFNNKTNMFDCMGSNYKIIDLLGQQDAASVNQQILTNYISTKKIDYFLTATKHGYILLIPSLDAARYFDTSGSEMRTAGRNHMGVFTPMFLNQNLKQLNAHIFNNRAEVMLNQIEGRKGRGTDKITRYYINNFMFILNEDITIKNNKASFLISKVKQLKPTLSVHIYLKED